MNAVLDCRARIWRLRSIAVSLVALLVGCASSLAAPIERDLGQGLRYIRLRELPADLPAKSESGPSLPFVVDVRYLPADAETAASFDAWLRFRATPRAPVFLVANSETSPAVLRLLAQRNTSGVVVVGAQSPLFAPDVAVRVSSENEQRAYAALTEGASLASLLTDNPDKVRNDEASLSRDRLAEASAESTAGETVSDRPRPPLDLALQRAVHLHRALLALRKI